MVFQKGEAFRSIASLEMLSTLLGIMFRTPCKVGGALADDGTSGVARLAGGERCCAAAGAWRWRAAVRSRDDGDEPRLCAAVCRVVC